jgi:hypothetical protein
MAKNGHALIFVALKGANFTEVETYKYNANTNNCIANQGALSSCIINCND